MAQQIEDFDPTLAVKPPPAVRLEGRPFGEIAVAMNLVTSEILEHALGAQAEDPDERIGQVLLKGGHLTPLDVAKVLSVQLDMPFLEKIDIDKIPDELVQTVPIGFAKQHAVLPLQEVGDSILVAIDDPLDADALDDVALLLGRRVSPVISLPETITDAINRVYDRATGLAHEAVQRLQTDEESEEDIDAIDLIDEASGDDAPIIRFVNALLRDAVKSRASDIHIEGFDRRVVVRNRIDGILYKKVEAPKHAQASIVARVKIMAGLNIAEKRLPQDGRIRRKIAGKDIDVRVSTVPTAHGERIVMRILDRSNTLLSIEDLGFSEKNYQEFSGLISRPHGILLVSGPTGSGKTTTLYAALSKINSPDINILTVEDPVEYQLPGVGQMQVNSKIDLTFANGLRSFLRQDPDVIMVGEIRDRETAEIAIQASLTGHLVLSTVHTNDSPGAVTRLVDMGVEPFLVSSTLSGVLAQRLVRNLCNQCKEPYEPTADQCSELGIKPQPGLTFYKEVGCANCLETGYRGRSGIYELLTIDDEVRRLILKNVDAGTIKRYAVSSGMRTLLMDGARKALSGQTTPEEVLRVAKDEEVVVE
ncbi:MAG TPA: type II secretion system ATPase GspE [Myxococcales bacterium LLY-WYZ-16_1]|jgi:general secretion pathway protein E|nr:type II secretion system ATPase GspE [Myxococcales bacterium LLY-WYZ-16_1]